MLIFTRTQQIIYAIASEKDLGNKIAFVPTMGALHQGHLSLIELAREASDTVVCSIFVNPTQFNESADLLAYPRTLDTDLRALLELQCDIAFIPSVEQVYPAQLDTSVDIDLNGLDAHMEGAHRPGHFQGMMQVVNRLINIVDPDLMIMGQKDYQQYKIVDKMIREMNYDLDLLLAPVSREHDGLARSSRNKRLSSDSRQKAPILYDTLKWVEKHFDEFSVNELKKNALERISQAGLIPEYLEIADPDTLEPVQSTMRPAVVCVAAQAGDVRLIDNILIGRN